MEFFDVNLSAHSSVKDGNVFVQCDGYGTQGKAHYKSYQPLGLLSRPFGPSFVFITGYGKNRLVCLKQSESYIANLPSLKEGETILYGGREESPSYTHLAEDGSIEIKTGDLFLGQKEEAQALTLYPPLEAYIESLEAMLLQFSTALAATLAGQAAAPITSWLNDPVRPKITEAPTQKVSGV